jgi:hypothetical protein
MQQVSEKRQHQVIQPQLLQAKDSQQHQQHRRSSSLNPVALLNAMKRRKSESYGGSDKHHHTNNPLYQSIGLLLLEEDSESEEIKDDDTINNDSDTITPLHSYGSVPNMEVQERFTRSMKKQTSFHHQVTKKLRFICRCTVCWSFVYRYLICSYLIMMAVPMFLFSALLYYGFNNPILHFLNLPGMNVTMSWWLNFGGRQIIVFELARMTQWILVDCILLGTRLTKFLGPYVTLVGLQARGFPFLITVWALLDIVLLRGTSRFHIHWLYWTCKYNVACLLCQISVHVSNVVGIIMYIVVRSAWSIYSQGNSGAFILASDLYLRVLLSMILIGLATTVKRVVVALRFGKRLLGM